MREHTLPNFGLPIKKSEQFTGKTVSGQSGLIVSGGAEGALSLDSKRYSDDRINVPTNTPMVERFETSESKAGSGLENTYTGAGKVVQTQGNSNKYDRIPTRKSGLLNGTQAKKENSDQTQQNSNPVTTPQQGIQQSMYTEGSIGSDNYELQRLTYQSGYEGARQTATQALGQDFGRINASNGSHIMIHDQQFNGHTERLQSQHPPSMNPSLSSYFRENPQIMSLPATQVYTPSVSYYEPKPPVLSDYGVVVFNQRQVAKYVYWKENNPHAPFEQFMDLLRRSSQITENLRLQKNSISPEQLTLDSKNAVSNLTIGSKAVEPMTNYGGAWSSLDINKQNPSQGSRVTYGDTIIESATQVIEKTGTNFPQGSFFKQSDPSVPQSEFSTHILTPLSQDQKLNQLQNNFNQNTPAAPLLQFSNNPLTNFQGHSSLSLAPEVNTYIPAHTSVTLPTTASSFPIADNRLIFGIGATQTPINITGTSYQPWTGIGLRPETYQDNSSDPKGLWQHNHLTNSQVPVDNSQFTSPPYYSNNIVDNKNLPNSGYTAKFRPETIIDGSSLILNGDISRQLDSRRMPQENHSSKFHSETTHLYSTTTSSFNRLPVSNNTSDGLHLNNPEPFNSNHLQQQSLSSNNNGLHQGLLAAQPYQAVGTSPLYNKSGIQQGDSSAIVAPQVGYPTNLNSTPFSQQLQQQLQQQQQLGVGYSASAADQFLGARNQGPLEYNLLGRGVQSGTSQSILPTHGLTAIPEIFSGITTSRQEMSGQAGHSASHTFRPQHSQEQHNQQLGQNNNSYHGM